jgi:hypothetical protein
VKAGAQLLGVTTGTDPHIVYFTAASTLEAVPVAGGTPEVLATGLAGTDSALVSGGAVAWFTGQDAVTKRFAGSHVWTKTYGKKDIASATHGLFSASEDGTRIAIEVEAADDLTGQMAVTDAAAPVITAPALSGANAINLPAYAADNCAPQLGFASTTFIGAFCTGTDSTAVNARLVTVAAGETAATVRYDNTAGGIVSFWSADTTGTKIAVADNSGAAIIGKVLITAGAATTVGTVETGLTTLDMLGDGSAIVYRTSGNALKKATVAATPVISTMATGVLGIHTVDAARKRFAYWTLESGFGDFDLITVDASSATPTPAVIVPTAVAYGVSFTGTGASVVYLDTYNDTDGTGKLKSKPAAGGGTEILLDTASLGAFTAPAGTGVLTFATATAVGGSTTQYNLTLKYADALVGGALKTGASNVLYDTSATTSAWSAKTFVHTNLGAAPGISKLVLP